MLYSCPLYVYGTPVPRCVLKTSGAAELRHRASSIALTPRPWDEHSRLRRSAGNQRACLLTTLFVLPTVRVLTTLKAPDERGEATLPQVRGSSLLPLP